MNSTSKLGLVITGLCNSHLPGAKAEAVINEESE